MPKEKVYKDLYQYLLPSGRGVRLTELSPTEKDESERSVARELGKDAAFGDFTLSAIRAGIVRMVRFVSKDKGYKKPEELLDSKVSWVEVDLGDMDENYDKYFSAKDDSVLSHIYRKLHVASMDDIEAIVGKEQMVSTD